jgi:pyruvate/2-oxoglutarate dehydrogenase complex dihydrolipoamide acyltransferase (E2) component
MTRFHRLEGLPAWRVMALHAWDAPRDPSVYGLIEVPVEPAQRYIARLREESGMKVTLTHLVGKAVGVALAERPEVNAIVRRGRLYARDTIDVFFQVAFEGGENLAGAKVGDVDKKSVVEIARELGQRAERIRTKKDDPTQESARMLSRLPPRLVRTMMKLTETLTYDFDLDLSRFGIPYDAFGSCMVTNVAGYGLTVGHAPLFPPGRVAIVLTVGAVREVPAVVDGKLIARQSLAIGASFDHRIMDGYHAGRLAKRFREVLENPETALAPAG